MARTTYASNVFFNCPFDEEYDELRDALVFAIFDCGFIPRCALEEDDGGIVRFEKLRALIEESKYGIHDISRTQLDRETSLPRFNMPLELGVFIGAKKFGDSNQQHKSLLILDSEPYRYQKFISDIAGHDIRSHQNDPNELIARVRDWLNQASGRRTIPGGKQIQRRYQAFQSDLPQICENLGLEADEVTYNDYTNFVSEWLRQYADDGL